MSRLHPTLRQQTVTTVSPQPTDGQLAQANGRPRRTSHMRRYEAASLLADLSISQQAHVAPAIPLFENATCALARGTLIATMRGPVAIEDLLPGDYIDTHRGPECVLWIGSCTYTPNRDPLDDNPMRLTRVMSDAFGPSRPMGHLLAGPAAAIRQEKTAMRNAALSGSFITPLADFVDGDRVIEVTPPSPVQLYHLALARHAIIRAAGVEVETYHPGPHAGADIGPNTRAVFLSMFQHVSEFKDFGDMAFPRASRATLDRLSVA